MLNAEVNRHHICAICKRQFIDIYSPPKGYSNEIKQESTLNQGASQFLFLMIKYVIAICRENINCALPKKHW